MQEAEDKATQAIQRAKQALREQVRARLRGLGEAERATASARARARLKAQTLWHEAQGILFFAPLPGELDVWPLLSEALALGKKVALPRFAADRKVYEACVIEEPEVDLRAGHFGIREPSDRCAACSGQRLGLILVPGVAFDVQGRRLGRGKAYYDRLLAAVAGTRCGVAFDEQVVEEVPTVAHDMSMDYILTPTRWIETKS